MKSYSETVVFPATALGLFKVAQQLVDRIQDPAPGEPPWRCHEVARAVRKALIQAPRFYETRVRLTALEVLDGEYGGVEHSWLAFSCLLQGSFILDVYAVGRLPQVQLVDPHVGLACMYQASFARDDIDESVVDRMMAWMCPPAPRARLHSVTVRNLGIGDDIKTLTESDHDAAVLALTVVLDIDGTRDSQRRALSLLFARHRESAVEEASREKDAR